MQASEARGDKKVMTRHNARIRIAHRKVVKKECRPLAGVSRNKNSVQKLCEGKEEKRVSVRQFVGSGNQGKVVHEGKRSRVRDFGDAQDQHAVGPEARMLGMCFQLVLLILLILYQ